MRKIGITGSIGAGKSLVSSLLRERGYTVLDADSQVHELYRDCKELRAELAEAFGPQSLTESGVNRKFFAGLIFGDVHARERLEGIVYPHLTRAVREFLDDNPNGAANAQPRFLEAAILSRVPEIVGMLDEIWVVDAPEATRLQRLIARGMEAEDAKRRILDQAGVCDIALFPVRQNHVLVRRDTREKTTVKLDNVKTYVSELLETIQQDMYDRASKYLFVPSRSVLSRRTALSLNTSLSPTSKPFTLGFRPRIASSS